MKKRLEVGESVVEEKDETYSLVFKRLSHKFKNYTYNIYECKCGNEKIVREDHVKSERIASCGCKRKNSLKIHRINPKQLSEGEGSFRKLLYGYKRGANTRGYVFELTEEEFKCLTKGSCYFCGELPIKQFLNTKSAVPYIYNGIDRLDNNKGYIKNNCVSCCQICNVMKMTLSEEEFTNKVKKICHHLQLISPNI